MSKVMFGIKWFVLGVIFTVALSGTVVVASPALREIIFGVTVSVNGVPVNFGDGMEPFIMEGRTYLPVRAVAELAGYNVDFTDGEPGEVRLMTDGYVPAVQGPDIPRGGGTANINGTTQFSFNPSESGIWELFTSDSVGDPFLWLYDSRGQLVAHNDDGGGSLNSRIRTNLSAEMTYNIRAGFYSTGTGSYTLNVTQPQVQRSEMPGSGGNLQINGETSVSFNPEEAGLWELRTEDNIGDPLLTLYNASGEEVARNDDGGSGLNSRIRHDLNAGENYRINAGFFADGTGSYTLNAARMVVHEITDGHSMRVEGETFIRFTPETSGWWVFRTSDNVGDPILNLYDDDFEIAYDDDSGEGLNALMMANLTAGATYELVATFYSGTGSFTLEIAQLETQTDDALVERWIFEFDFHYDYEDEDSIEFRDDGTYVYFYRDIEYDYGSYVIIGDGILIMQSEWGSQQYMYEISGDTLTIQDNYYYDTMTLRRYGTESTNPNRNTGSTGGTPVPYDGELLGRWEYVSGTGPYIYYFMSDGDIEFFADGTVMEYAYHEPGTFTVDGNRITVNGEMTGINRFTFLLIDDLLILIDIDGDTGTWRRK